MLKVLKALAEYHDLTVGDLLEGIVLHAFDGLCPFNNESLQLIACCPLNATFPAAYSHGEACSVERPGWPPFHLGWQQIRGTAR